MSCPSLPHLPEVALQPSCGRFRSRFAILCLTGAATLLVVFSSGPGRAQDPLSALKELSSSQPDDKGGKGEKAAGAESAESPEEPKPEEVEAKSEGEVDAAQEVASTVWRYPLFRSGSDEKGNPTYVHLNELLIGLAAFLIIFFLGRALVRQILDRLLGWLHVPAPLARIIQKAVSVALVLVGAIVGMVVGGLPWSFLAFGLGLAALGMTLGAQKLLGNYLSGFVMVMERVAEPGDCIEIEGEVGYVMEIAGRYTRVRRFDGIDVLLPNSRMLESSFVNWSVNNGQVRDRVSVSVTYGASSETVMDILAKQAAELDAVLDDPKPVVLLRDFEDSGVRFDVYFWTEAHKPTELWLAASDLRARVYDAFSEAGIEFAFPQRELHFNRDKLSVKAPTTRSNKDQSGDSEASDALSGQDVAEEDDAEKDPKTEIKEG